MSTVEERDWVTWHEEYDDADSRLSKRLRVVQDEVRRVLPERPAREIRIVSLCAGQARDVIGVLAEYPHAAQVSARVVELNPRNVEIARHRADNAGVQLEIIEGDAGDTGLYEGSVPADLVVAVGIFGHLSDEHLTATVRALPQFAAHGATVIWSLGRRDPDPLGGMRELLAETGFVETAFHAPEELRFRIGVSRYEGQPQPLVPAHLFTFTR